MGRGWAMKAGMGGGAMSNWLSFRPQALSVPEPQLCPGPSLSPPVLSQAAPPAPGCVPGPLSAPPALSQSPATPPRPAASPGLHAPFRRAGHPPAADLLQRGVRQLDAQGQQRGPHGQPQRGPQPAPPEVHPQPAGAPALLARHKHGITGLGHLWEGRAWATPGSPRAHPDPAQGSSLASTAMNVTGPERESVGGH